jgi:hypothetical protein
MSEMTKCPACKRMFASTFSFANDVCQPCDIDQRIGRFEKRMREVQDFMREHLAEVHWEQAPAWAKRKKKDLEKFEVSSVRGDEPQLVSLPATAIVLHPRRKPMNEKLVFVYPLERSGRQGWTFWPAWDWSHSGRIVLVHRTESERRFLADARDCRAAAIMATWAPYLSF